MKLEETTLGAVVARTGGSLQTGPFGSQLHASDYTTLGTPLVMPINLGDNEIREEGIARVGPKDVRRLRRHALREGDIVFSRRGDVGRRSLIRPEYAGWLCGTGCLAAKFGSRLSEVNPAFVALYLGAARAQMWLTDNAVGGTMPNLNTGILSAVPILLPSRKVQDAIVDAIDSAHSAATDLQRLIAKKQAIKQGIMQQLLAGRIRMGGFTEPWATSRLVDVTHRIGSGITPRGGSAVYTHSGRPFVRSQNVGWGELRLDDLVFIDETTHSTFPATEIRVGDVLLNITGASIGRAAVATSALDGGNVNQHVCEIRVDPSRMNPDFVSAVLNSAIGQRQIDAYQAGGNRQGLNFQQVGSIRVPSISLAEQALIAGVLLDFDDELQTLRLRLTKARDIKTGMMQQLLTGRTRLSIPEGAAR
ncbi:restriction endonuclease subunit S [Mycolicibacterium austroafricanum]|uniref:Restriction endonuclease subunit S n=1 Tax=Mycolicibacterium austroafricanum TaxID=39687 RepID=A0ABT8HMR2_MYCAO|nr:restriction endonuclease subunit S [Mycolicibacterium austroafricanum]MDN4522060.1 restriction endonuclease subunit S [Mycolicibacterium austroafricanum]